MKLVEAQEGRRILDRLVGYEVSNVAFRRIGPGTSAGRVQSVATRLVVDRERARMAFRSGSYWDLEGTFGADEHRRSPRRSSSSTASASRRAATSTPPPVGCNADRRRRAARRGRRGRARRRACSDQPFTVASVETRAHYRAPARRRSPRRRCSRRPAASSASARRARCTSPRGSTSVGSSPTCGPTPRRCPRRRSAPPAARSAAVRRGLPPRPAAPVPQQGEERAGGARGDPPRRRPHAHRRRRRPRAQRHRRAPPLRPHLEAHGRVADGRRPHPAGHPPARRDVDRAARRPTFQATGRTIEFLGYLACLRRGRRRPGRRARGPRGDPPAARGGRDGRVPRAAAVGSHHATAGALHRGEPGEGARGARHRPPVHVRVGDRDHPPRATTCGKKGTALVPTWTAFAKVQLLERYFAHLIDYEFTATMEEALDVDRTRRGRSREVAPLLLLRQRPGRLRDLVAEEHLAQIDKAEVNTVHIGVDGDGRELIVRVWPNGANVERGDEKGPVPADLAPDELTPEKADELLAVRHRPPRGRHRSRDRPPRARAHRSLRSVRAARRAGAGLEGEAQARVAVRVDGPGDGHARGGAGAAVAAARRRRRRRRRGDHRAERSLRSLPQEGHRQPEPRAPRTSSSR